ncbi:hypothetical protein Bbelb_442550 [Branchiostoma belcheri]|nr:hypothetical protein Bbelb_442550 [Branchiostoma belcheri]
MTSDGEHTDMVTLVPVTSVDVTSASPTSDHVTNTTTTSSDVTCTSSSVETTSDHVTSVETTSDHVTSKDTTSDHVTSVARTSDHVTSKATTSDHVTTVATASTHVTSVATASTHVTTSATTSTHVTSKSTASSHVTAVATTSGHVTPAAAVVQSSVVTSGTGTNQLYKVVPVVQNGVPCRLLVPLVTIPYLTVLFVPQPAAVAAPGGTHQLYQVVPVVQNGVPCRLLVPLPCRCSCARRDPPVVPGGTCGAERGSLPPAGPASNHTLPYRPVCSPSPAAVAAPGGTHQLYQVVPVVQNGVPCRLLVPLNMLPPGAKVVTKTVPPAADPPPPAVSGSARLLAHLGAAAGRSSKFLLQQVKVTPQPGSPVGVTGPATGGSAVVHVLSPAGSAPAAAGTRTGKDGKPPGTVGSPGTAVAMSSASGPTGAVQKVIAVPPTVAAGSRPGTAPAVPSGSKPGTYPAVPSGSKPVTPQAVAPGITLVPGTPPAAVPGTKLSTPPAKPPVLHPAASMPSTSAVYNIIKVTPPPPGGTLTIGPNTRLVVVSGPSTGVTQSLGPRTSATLGNVAVVTPTVKPSAKTSVLKTQPSAVPVGRPMVTTSAGQHKIVFVPQTGTVSAPAPIRTGPQTSRLAAAPTAAQLLPNKPAPKQVSMVQQSENVVLINGQPYKLIPCPTTTHIPVDALKSSAAAATVTSASGQVVVSSDAVKAAVKVSSDAVQAVSPATPTQVTASTSTATNQTQVTASNSTAGGVTEASPVRSETGEGTALKIDSVYSLNAAPKPPASPASKPALAAKTIAQTSSAANTLKNIATIHSAVTTPKPEPAETKPAQSPAKTSAHKTPDRSPAKQLKPAEKSPAKKPPPKSVTEMYHSYAKAEAPDVPTPQVKRSVTALMVRTTPLGKSPGTVAMSQDTPDPPSLPPARFSAWSRRGPTRRSRTSACAD